MAENPKLQDVLLIELSDVSLFCKLIKFPSIRENMLKVFKVSVVQHNQLIFTFTGKWTKKKKIIFFGNDDRKKIENLKNFSSLFLASDDQQQTTRLRIATNLL